MQTIRGRLTLAYSFALTLTIGLFAIAVYVDQRKAAEKAERNAIQQRLHDDSQAVTQWLQYQWELARSLGRPSLLIPAIGEGGNNTALSPSVNAFLTGIRSWVYVADPRGANLFMSEAARNLDISGLTKLQALLKTRPAQTASGQVELIAGQAPFYYLIQPLDTLAGPEISSLLFAAQPTGELLRPEELLRSMALIAPFILVASSILGYLLAGRALQPVDFMIQELEGVQDGTSLHRRLAVPSGQDELSRLARTLNAMLGRVEQSFVALRRFTADASHELKTPLMVLRAGVERSLTHPQSPPDVVAALDETLGQINRMGELVGNLLTLARADEGRASLVLAEHDLREIVIDVAETAEILGEERGLTIMVETPTAPLCVPMDHSRIRELLLNLVTNAVKYTPAGGEVIIRLEKQGSTVLLEVQDSGIGIAPGDLAHIFERFWRVDQVRSREGDRPGTGLGLAIARWIAEAHGGTITVRSRPGRGSTFSVVLPSISASAEREAVANGSA